MTEELAHTLPAGEGLSHLFLASRINQSAAAGW